MKKFVIIGLAVFTVAVGVAFAGTLRTTYTECGHTVETQIDGDDVSVSRSGKCPSCQRAQDASRRRESRRRESKRNSPISGSPRNHNIR